MKFGQFKQHFYSREIMYLALKQISLSHLALENVNFLI